MAAHRRMHEKVQSFLFFEFSIDRDGNLVGITEAKKFLQIFVRHVNHCALLFKVKLISAAGSYLSSGLIHFVPTFKMVLVVYKYAFMQHFRCISAKFHKREAFLLLNPGLHPNHLFFRFIEFDVIADINSGVSSVLKHIIETKNPD